MESYHDGIFPSLISQGENSSKLFSFLHVFLNVKIYRCLLGESKCCKRASSRVSTSTETGDQHQDIRGGEKLLWGFPDTII